jgi:predicted acyl esterase
MPLPLQDIYSKEVVENYIFERNVSIPLQTGVNKGLPLRINVYRPNKEGSFPVICTLGPCKPQLSRNSSASIVSTVFFADRWHSASLNRWQGLALLDLRRPLLR